jgi:hypothetical protein
VANLKHVQRGDPLRIPANDWNAIVDATRAYYEKQLGGTGRSATAGTKQAGIVLVHNDSGADASRFDVLGIDSPVISPTDNLEEFSREVALACVAPTAADHAGAFVVLQEPIAAGKLGRAVIDGVTPARVNVSDEKHRFAAIEDGSSTSLVSRAVGPVSILWSETGTGEVWAVVRLDGAARNQIIPVELSQVGGTQGDDQTVASWTYDVLDPVAGETLETAVDPTADPHKWKRPSVGFLVAATFGYAHYQLDDTGTEQLVLGWINEIPETEACQDSSE